MEPNNRNISFFMTNADVLKGYKLSATIQLRTPLKYLEMHGQVLDLKSELPEVPQAHGSWVPECKSWKELGISLKEPPESTMASDVGQIPTSGGQYLEFLKAFRKIVESKMNPEQKKDAIFLLGLDNDYFAHVLSIHPDLQEDKLNQWLGYDELLGIPGFNPTQAKTLYEAGFKDAVAVGDATDKDLLSVKGIGPAKIKQIRTLQALWWKKQIEQ